MADNNVELANAMNRQIQEENRRKEMRELRDGQALINKKLDTAIELLQRLTERTESGGKRGRAE